MTVTDRIFQNVAELSVPNFFITVEFSVMGNEMPEHIESFVLEKYQAILHGANGRKFVYTEGGWRLFFTFFPTDKVVDERYALKNKVQDEVSQINISSIQERDPVSYCIACSFSLIQRS